MTKMNYFPLPPEVAKIPLDDYTGVIAFSGGVESTALMAWVFARKEKVVAFNFALALPEPPYGPIEVWLATQRINAKQIAEKFNIPLIEIDLQMTNLMTVRHEEPEYKYSFQRWYISFFLGMMTVYNPKIENLYYGLNDTDSTATTPELRKTFEDIITRMCGENRLSTPLSTMSKKEQWALIPDDVKQIVLTCTQHVCGTCFKCQERIDAGIPLK
jgi:7-cyano-7-deazaguanine synthase in queuosine biosynthesis